MNAAIRDLGTYLSSGQCDWVNDSVSHWQFDLACFRDCDGGSFSVFRLPFSESIVVLWQFLRMSKEGCDGGEVLSGPSSTAVLWLDRIPSHDCQVDSPP